MIEFTKEIIDDLESKYDLPLYVFDEEGFKEDYRELTESMKSLYEKYQIAYSFKTNYTPYICNLVKEAGGYAEVVSDMEYQLALDLGFEPQRIIYNGPDKAKEAVAALQRGSIVNIDSIDELLYVRGRLASSRDSIYRIGIRMNLDVGQNFVSRFGIDERDLVKAIEIVKESGNLVISGLQCHISRCRDLNSWLRRTEYMLGLSRIYFNDSLEYIDLGSGMFGKMPRQLRTQFDAIPSFEDYADVTARLFKQHFESLPLEKRPILFTEPGTTLISRHISLISRIDGIKNARGKSFALLNCSIHNIGEICLLKRAPFTVISGGEEKKHYENIDLCGYTCLEQDVIYKDYSGDISVGDFMVFENVGGYSNVCKPPFIRPNCAMVTKRNDSSYRIIKRKENYKDIFETYS